MKKIFIMVLTITLSLTLHAQTEADAGEYQPIYQPEWDIDPLIEEDQKKPFTFARESFEFGIDVGVGFDNDLIVIGDLLKRDVIIDLNAIGGNIRETGLTLNIGVGTDIFVNIKNIKISKDMWEFGFFFGVDGSVNFNIPESLFILISEGNINQRVFDGMISASGAIFADAGLRASSQFGKLRVGGSTSLFSPLVFIPKSGISYYLDTEKVVVEEDGVTKVKEGVYFKPDGNISIYSPFMTESGGFGKLNFGFDISAEGEYALFPFLDVGGSISRIPIVPAIVEDRMLLTLEMDSIKISADDLLSGKEIDFDFNLDFNEAYNTKEYYVLRPMRLDIHARYKPFNNNMLVIRPNMGLSVDFNNEEAFFNAGVGVQFNLKELFIASIGTDYTESIWTHQLGLALNLKAFELNLKAAVRSAGFVNSFQGQGFGVGVGLRFGW